MYSIYLYCFGGDLKNKKKCVKRKKVFALVVTHNICDPQLCPDPLLRKLVYISLDSAPLSLISESK